MTGLILVNDHSIDVHIETASEFQIVEAINALDGRIKLAAILNSLYGLLFIASCVEGRMRVHYSRMGELTCLIDKQQVGVQTFEFQLDSGQVDNVPIRETLSRQIAIKVALYFFQHNCFPAELTWDGDIQYLPVEGMLPFLW